MSFKTKPAMPESILTSMGFPFNQPVYYQLPPETLSRQTVQRGEGVLNDTGALVISTGEFTGRSPDDKFIVKDELTAGTIDWNHFNNAIEAKYFNQLHAKMVTWLAGKEIWIRDCYACAHPAFRVNIRVINENPWSNLFAYNMFLRPGETSLENFTPDWHVIHAPCFKADPLTDGVPRSNFTIVNFSQKIILIGGSGYTGEIKKGIFSVLNYLLPKDSDVLSMHCAANAGNDGNTAIFFGLSGTGKTTLSADPDRYLIGDDEHGWTGDTVFNFEGGCYAKTIDLNAANEPEIFRAIRPGAMVENVTFIEGTNRIDFASKKITQNTRVSYPLHFISNALEISVGGIPKNIFFLTCDSYGILPPISKLTAGQAMYQFISGYTAKIAGTEAGITEPKATFSACFGAPFLPLHPGRYAGMLGKKMKENKVNVWMVNTGWSGGPYGIGKRIPLNYTRAMIAAVLNETLSAIEFIEHPVFGVLMPVSCAGVPAEILNPKNTWVNKANYDAKAKELAALFIANFEKYKNEVGEEIVAASPRI
ncbi:phosphoenolpyruvate carboxykinase (ATP) [Ferruginibacter paludis]|nr:phosphoenolpyruvate carboxykinase (ATP) [Ferruginibacter paludis]